MQLGNVEGPPGAPAVTSVPTQPMHQLFTPGGSCTSKSGLVTFQATALPASQPWPEPKLPRSEKAIPGVPDVPPGNWLLSANMPVAQRWGGANPRLSELLFSNTTEPVTYASAPYPHTPASPFEHHFSATPPI